MKKSRRKDVIIARVIFAILVLALIALIVFGIRAFILYRMGDKNNAGVDTQVSEEMSTQEDSQENNISADNNDEWLVDDGNDTTETVDTQTTEPTVEIEENVEPETESEPQIVLQAMYRVNLRADSNTDASVLGVVSKMDKVVLLEELDNGWGQVQYGDMVGYVYLEYFLMLDPEETDDGAPSEGTDAQENENANTAKVVVLDPGHQSSGDSVAEPNGPNSATMKARCTGGTTGVATGEPEYQLVLDIALALQTELESRGYTVYLTRTTNDVNISNVERAQYATSVGGDITVRIHANGADDANLSGALALVPSSDNPYVPQLADSSSALAAAVLKEYCEQTGLKNWGTVTTDSMTGINWSTMPVAILEMGYMTNESDDKNMQDAAFQQKMVLGIADGIDAYFN